MRAGLWTGFFLNEERNPDPETVLSEVRRLKNAGFCCGELDERNAFALFVAGTQEEADRNAALLAEQEFFSQLHSPKPTEDRELQMKCEQRILRACRLMGISVTVTHPFIAHSPETEPKEKSLEYLKRYTEAAETENVKVALENQIYPVSMQWYLDRIPALGVNIDFAHALASGKNVPEMIRETGNRLYGLHVSDSDGRPEDWHVMPGKGILDWEEVFSALKAVGYAGDLHLEIVHERSCVKSENDRTAGEAFQVCENLLRKNVEIQK